MKNFRPALSLALFLFLAFSCVEIFYVEFDKDREGSSNNNLLVTTKQERSWSAIPCPADGFDIITKATLIAQRMEQEKFSKVSMPVLALQ